MRVWEIGSVSDLLLWVYIILSANFVYQSLYTIQWVRIRTSIKGVTFRLLVLGIMGLCTIIVCHVMHVLVVTFNCFQFMFMMVCSCIALLHAWKHSVIIYKQLLHGQVIIAPPCFLIRSKRYSTILIHCCSLVCVGGSPSTMTHVTSSWLSFINCYWDSSHILIHPIMDEM